MVCDLALSCLVLYVIIFNLLVGNRRQTGWCEITNRVLVLHILFEFWVCRICMIAEVYAGNT